MVFSSTIFLFGFLPVVLAVYFLLRSVRARNAFLLAASLFFYTWGELGYVTLLLASVLMNWGFGLLIDRRRSDAGPPRMLHLAIALNLTLLVAFKYANFIVDNLNTGLASLGIAPLQLDPVHLPIGISFFTFQALSYVVDVHRGDAPVQRSLARVGLFISLFPQLIAGPIVRYHQIANQLSLRITTTGDVARGLRRFVVGLGKKVLVANTLAIAADSIFALPPSELTAAVAWLGLVCFSLQIYFDFAGYSDMAIGLGYCLGFRFPENFDWPYLSGSIRTFWRRWHISLSTFFRDYLYIPLGGNRGTALRTHTNLIAVFLLCGLWHGASWSFVVWGASHGAFLVLERGRFGALLDAAPGWVRQAYTLGVLAIAWVFFRADDLHHAGAYLTAMFGAADAASTQAPFALFWNAQLGFVLALALLSVIPRTRRTIDALATRASAEAPLAWAQLAATLGVLVLCSMSLVSGTHNPFIYFRF